MAHASSPTSTILPTEVSGFLIEDETVSSYTAVKKAASPNPLTSPSFCPLSNTQPSHLVRGCGGRDRTVGVEARGQRVVARRVVEADMRGLVTAGPCVRLERCAGLRTSVARFFFVERDLAAHSLGARCSSRCGSSTVDPTELDGTRGLVGQHRQGPAPAGQFAGDGDVGDHRPFLAQVQVDPAGVQPAGCRHVPRVRAAAGAWSQRRCGTTPGR